MGYKKYLSLGIALKDTYIFLIICFVVSLLTTLIYKLYLRSKKNNTEYIDLGDSR